MATMIGPWIAPTLVLIAGLALRLKKKSISSQKQNQEIALIQTVGSIGGIIATAVGFTLPTLYFLDKPAFEQLLENPATFCILIGAIVLGSGSLGILLGRAFGRKLLVKENLPFPIGHLIHKTITSQSQTSQAKRMLTGFSITGLFCALRDSLSLPSLIPAGFPITLMPMLWAIGFIAGTAIAYPLLVGMISKYLVLYPINNHASYLPIKLFPVLDKALFSMAFCSGLILAQVLPGLLRYPSIIWGSIKQYSGYTYLHRFRSGKSFIRKLMAGAPKLLTNLEAIFALAITAALFTYLKFPLSIIFVMIPLTVVSAYHISYIAGKIGLAQIGRFTTFVMIPIMLLFKLTPLQITVLCVFVSSCITVSTDLLIDYKVGELCNINLERIRRYQWLGLIVTAACLGYFLWILLTNLQVGSTELFAQRGKARALLIQSFNFNWVVVSLGFLYGLILKKLKINPTMVFGGILMPNGLTIGLVFGATLSLFVKNKENYMPFCSGIFASESLWMIIRIAAGII